MRRRRTIALAGVSTLALTLGLGCATTDIQPTGPDRYAGTLPRPDLIVILPFATSPDEVQLDWSPTVIGAWKLEGRSRSSEEETVAHQVADTLAKHLVEKVRALGLPAQLSTDPILATSGTTIVISGQFLAIDQGNRAERVVIGLGAGRSAVHTAVQVYERIPDGRRTIDEFEIEAKSGFKPGAAETMGVGGATGNLALSAAVTAAGTVASETFGADVDADAERTAAKIEKALHTLFERQGWIDAD